jgi:hypothetical protein
MRPVTFILVIFLTIAFLANGKSFVLLGGNDGNSLLRDLANKSDSLNLSKGNNTEIDNSHSRLAMPLGGDDAMNLLKNLTNNLSNQSAENNTQGNLSTWGSRPHILPPPPDYDTKRAQTIAILRQNHLGAE